MTAPEPTPLEAAAEAMHDQRCSGDGACDHGGRFEQLAALALTAGLAGDWLERVLGEHADFTYVDTPADPAHFVCDCGHAFGYEDGAHAEWEAHLAAAIRTASGVEL